MKDFLFLLAIVFVFIIGGAAGVDVERTRQAKEQAMSCDRKAIESTIEVGPGTFARVIVDQQSGRRAIVLPPGYSVVELQVASKDAR